MIKSISVPEWHEMAQRGEAPPMRILIQGGSMRPLIRRNRDYVTILPLEGTPVVGDIVLFSDPWQQNRFVVHRLWRTEKESVLTWGDNCRLPDARMPWDAVWGKVALIERGKKRIHPDPRRGMLLARCWHIVAWGRWWVYKVGGKLKRALKSLGKRTT